MRSHPFRFAATIVCASALALTGCAASSSASDSSANNGSGVVTAWGSEPQNPLVPTNTNETGGGQIIDEMFAGLVYYDAKGAPHNDLAQSITSTDAQHYDIKLKPGSVFSNGEKVTAASFVDAWNYGAKLSNKQLLSSFFQDIAGFSEDADSSLTGLKVVSDNEFTVDLKQKVSDFPLRLGFAAFYPLPKAAFADMKSFGEEPIGNGPYKFKSANAWKHNEQLRLVKSASYKGAREAKNGGLTFTFYSSLDAAYSDLQSGNLDVLYQLPDSALSTYKSDLGERWVNQSAAIVQTVNIPGSLPRFSGQEGSLRREAISFAINRQEITKVIFDGTRTPAKDFTSPVIDGWSGTISGSDVLSYDAKKAKALWAKADAISPWSGTFKIGYNADGGHQGWVDAVANSLKNTLGIDAQGAPSPTFAEFRTSITNRTIGTAFRSGWQADYPGMYNFLGAVYESNAGSNDGDYSSPEFDALLKKGLGETELGAANKDFEKAQQILFTDLPAIPLWYQNVTGGYSEAVSHVKFGWNSLPLYDQIVKK